MKRIAVAGAVLVCAAGVLAGCGSDDSDSDSTSTGAAATSTAAATQASTTPAEDPKATISFTSYSSYKAGYEAVLANFKTAHPNITVNVKYLDFAQLSTTLPTQMASGNAPDVLWSFPGSLVPPGTAIFARAGRLADQSNAPWADRIIAGAKEGVSANGKPYGWAVDGMPATIVYDKVLFDKLGLTVPTTFDELLATCKASADKGTPLIYESGYPSGLAAELTGNWVDGPNPDWMAKRAKGEVKFEGSPEWTAALQAAKDMKDGGCFQKNPQANPGRDQSFAAIAQGKAVALAANPASNAILEGINPKLDMQLMLLPGDTKESTYVSLIFPDAISVSETSKNKEAAQVLVDFFAEPEQGTAFAEANDSLSPDQLASGEWPSDYDSFRDVIDADRIAGSVYPEMPNPETNNAFIMGIVGLWTGQKDIPTILKEMDAAYDKGQT